MTGRRLTDGQISQALRAHVPERAQAGLRERILEAAATTAQRRSLPSFAGRAIALRGLQDPTGSIRTNRWTWVIVAAVVLTLLAASAIFVGNQRPSLLAIQPTPTSTSTSTPIPTPNAEVSPQATEAPPPAVGQSLELTWTKVTLDQRSPQVAWLGDRFVLVDEDSRAVFTSTDGFTWRALQPGDPDPGYFELLTGSFVSWQDSSVGWWNPQEEAQCGSCTNQPPITARDILQIVHPPAAPSSTTPFKGRIESIGIGPRGIVAQVHSDLDWDAWVTKKLGARSNNAWVKHLKSVDFRDGILQIKLDNGPGLKVVWADQGFEPGDYQDRGFGWYSPDGEHWTEMAPNDHPTADFGSSLPTGTFGKVVGVSDGFIAAGASPDGACADPNGSCTGMWYSSDGLTWRLLGAAPSEPQELLPWRGGVLVTDGDGRIAFWTSGGSAELPMAAQVRGTVAAGPLGLVSIGDGQVLVSRDGIDYKVSSIPAQMAAAQPLARSGPEVVVGERSVLVVLWSGSSEARIPSLWRGTFKS